MNTNIPTEFILTAAYVDSKKNGEYYNHFGIHHSLLSIYGVTEENLRRVKLQIIPEVNLENRKETNDVDYWGLWSYEKQQIMLVYPSFIQFYVCFPYGPKDEENRGRGKCVNLKVVEVLPYDNSLK